MNSGPQGPLSAVGLPIAESAQRFAASGPGQQSIGLACLGSIVLSFCGETWAAVGSAALSSWWFAGGAGVGLLLLVVGWRGARGPRNAVMALTSIATPCLLAAGVWCIWGPQAFHNAAVQWVSFPFLIGFSLRLVLSLRGISGNARKMVDQNIKANELDWDWNK